uniref:Uncharacterized protein n=1 Tax=Lepeophtheirus salmonis TaxID=72036 RepID=A0A0K2SZ92_LEPSM
MPKMVDPSVLINELNSTKIWTYVPEIKYLLCKHCNFIAKAKRICVLKQHRRTAYYKCQAQK